MTMNSRNVDKETLAFLLTTYKSLPDEEVKTVFIQKAEKILNVKTGQLLKRIELELVWENFRSNGVDSEYDPDNKRRGPAETSKASSSVGGKVAGSSSSKDANNTVSKLMQLLQDGERVDVLLGLLKKPEVFYCKYCKSLGLPKSQYLSHNMNSRKGNIICPRWNSYRYAFYINSGRGNAAEDSAQVEEIHE